MDGLGNHSSLNTLVLINDLEFTFKAVSCHLLLPSVSSGGWTESFDLELMRRVAYHCAATTGVIFSFKILI
jgi:hypothetical protein